MHVDGQCHCGRITFSAEIDPATVRVCHCADCQTFAGGAFRVGVAARADTVRIAGEPSQYVKLADSGKERIQAFCPTCASPIYTTGVIDKSVYILRTPLLAQKDQLPPQKQIWRSAALGWIDGLDDVPCVDGQA